MTAIQSDRTNLIAHSDILSSGVASAGNLTPEALMMYLSERLGSVDDQINTIMAKQKATENARKHVANIQAIYSGKEEGEQLTPDDQVKIIEELAAMEDPKLADRLAADLGLTLTGAEPELSDEQQAVIEAAKGMFGTFLADAPGDTAEDGTELDQATLDQAKTVLDNTLKEFESSASLDMIQLQSLMSARNTAISLATNMMSAVGKGLESIVGNIGR